MSMQTSNTVLRGASSALTEATKSLLRPQREKLSSFLMEVLSNRYMEPNRPPNVHWMVIHPKTNFDSMTSSFVAASEVLSHGFRSIDSGIPEELGLDARSALFLDSWNTVNAIGDKLHRSIVLDEVCGIFEKLPLENIEMIPPVVSSEIARQNALIACTIVIEDKLEDGWFQEIRNGEAIETHVAVEGINRIREVLRDGYGFAGQLGASTIVFTGIKNDGELLKHLQRSRYGK